MNKHEYDGGFVISASYYPSNWNGIKLFGKNAQNINMGEINARVLEMPDVELSDPNGENLKYACNHINLQ